MSRLSPGQLALDKPSSKSRGLRKVMVRMVGEAVHEKPGTLLNPAKLSLRFMPT